MLTRQVLDNFYYTFNILTFYIYSTNDSRVSSILAIGFLVRSRSKTGFFLLIAIYNLRTQLLELYSVSLNFSLPQIYPIVVVQILGNLQQDSSYNRLILYLLYSFLRIDSGSPRRNRRVLLLGVMSYLSNNSIEFINYLQQSYKLFSIVQGVLYKPSKQDLLVRSL